MIQSEFKCALPLSKHIGQLLLVEAKLLFSVEVVIVEDLVTPSEDRVTYFKFPRLKYEGPEAVDGIDLCCPDVSVVRDCEGLTKLCVLERLDETAGRLRA